MHFEQPGAVSVTSAQCSKESLYLKIAANNEDVDSIPAFRPTAFFY
jgi:hypothetical protein